MRHLFAALLALSMLSCVEDDSACNDLEKICEACVDADSVARCERLIKRRDQVDCSLALDELTLICVSEAGPPDVGSRDASLPVDALVSGDAL